MTRLVWAIIALLLLTLAELVTLYQIAFDVWMTAYPWANANEWQTRLYYRLATAIVIGVLWSALAKWIYRLVRRRRDMDDRVGLETKAASEFGGKAEKLVVAKGQCSTGDRNTPLMAYWSLAFEFHKAILNLIAKRFYGAAFALVRPLIVATIRSHLVIFVSDETLKDILADAYRTNFGTVGKEIDDAFGLEGFFENFLKGAKDALHGYTHIGTHQLGRRFTGTDLMPSYSQDEIIEVIRVSTSAVFMVSNIVTKHLGFEAEWKENNKLFDEWGKSHP